MLTNFRFYLVFPLYRMVFFFPEKKKTCEFVKFCECDFFSFLPCFSFISMVFFFPDGKKKPRFFAQGQGQGGGLITGKKKPSPHVTDHSVW